MRGWRPWTVQPPPGTPITEAGVVFLPSCSPLWRPGTTAKIVPSSRGIAYRTEAGATTGYASGPIARPGALSILAVAKFNNFNSPTFTAASATPSGAVIYSQRTVSTDVSPTLCVSDSSFTGSQYRLWFGTDTASVAYGQANSTIITTGKWYVLGASCSSAGVTGLTVNGFANETKYSTAGSWNSNWTGATGYVGVEKNWITYSGSVIADIEVALLLLLPLQKDVNWLQKWSANPWQIFHRRRRAYSLITGSTISASISEAVTSADAYAISATATATITTAVTSADSYALSATAAAAISEAATSADAYATSATIFATLTETIAPSDAYAIAVAVAAALDSSAAASSALTAVATIAATIAEVSTAQDTLGVTATVLAAIAEAATATDTQATGSVTSAAYADSATAAAIFNATVSIAATLTEAGLAADQIAAMATVAADLAESGAAADAYLSSVLLAVELLENAAAADELSATAFEQIIDAAKTIITILQAQDTVTLVQARDTVNIVQAQDTLRILQ